MNNKWDSIIEENVSNELKHRIQVHGELELQKLQKQSFLKNLIFLISPLGALGVLLLMVLRPQQNQKESLVFVPSGKDEDLNIMDMIEIEDADLEMLADLDFFEDFDTLEEWNG
jgi:hypothetical protein